MDSVYLGIDVGTTSAKCLAVNGAGEVLGLAQHSYQMVHRHQGWAEQNPQDYWTAVVDVVRRCVGECKNRGLSAGDIVAMAMSTQADTLIVTDDAGNPLLPAHTWMDSRGEVECNELLTETGKSFWYKETGMSLEPLSSACKIRWIEKNIPDVAAEIAHYCWVADFLAHKLCGKFVSDVPNASWTPLYSPTHRSWSNEVMRLLNIRQGALPEAIESGDEIGVLLPEAAAEMDLNDGVKLLAGAFDQTAAAFGAGGGASGKSVLSCGTAWVLYAVTTSPIVDVNESIPICCHCDPSQWGMVLPFTGGSAYDWLMNAIGRSDPSEASNSEPLTFIPHLYGGLCPDWRPESKGSLIGLTMAHTREDIRLAMMRGLAFEARRNVEAAESLDRHIEILRMVGGATKSDIWPQIISDILARPVEVSECAESACYGAAKLAAGAISKSWSGTGPIRRYEPDRDAVAREESAYRKYLKLYKAMLEVYEMDME